MPTTDGRKNNGGWRRNSGRHPTLQGKLKKGLLSEQETYIFENIVPKLPMKGQRRRKKISRGMLTLWRLREKGSAGDKKAQQLYLALEELNKTASSNVLAAALYEAGKDLQKNDRLYGDILRTAPIRPKPVYDESQERGKTNLKKIADEYNRKSEAQAQAAADLLKEGLEKLKSEKTYFIDENGRKVLLERAWKDSNAAGMFKRIEERERSRGNKPKPFDYQYRRNSSG